MRAGVVRGIFESMVELSDNTNLKAKERGRRYTVIMGRPSGGRTYDGHGLVYALIADDLSENTVQLVIPPGALGNAKMRALCDFAMT